MPVFIKFDGVEGSVTGEGSSAGAMVLMGDGSVKTVKGSINSSPGGGPRVNVYSGRSISMSAGHKFGLAQHFDSSGSAPTAIEISRIVLPNSPFGFDRIDSRDGDAGGKAVQLFGAAANSASGLIISITKTAMRAAANKMRCSNNLKQLVLASHAAIPMVEILVGDLGNSKPVAIELQDVIVSSYLVSAADGSGIPMENYSLNFAQIKYKYKP